MLLITSVAFLIVTCYKNITKIFGSRDGFCTNLMATQAFVQNKLLNLPTTKFFPSINCALTKSFAIESELSTKKVQIDIFVNSKCTEATLKN